MQMGATIKQPLAMASAAVPNERCWCKLGESPPVKRTYGRRLSPARDAATFGNFENRENVCERSSPSLDAPGRKSMRLATLKPPTTASSTKKRKLADYFAPISMNVQRRLQMPRFSPKPSSSDVRAKKRMVKYEQLYLELGQRHWGPVTCSECHMSYSRGANEDDVIHDRFHKAVVGGIDYPGYKGETVLRESPEDGSRIIMFANHSQCSAYNRRKIREILEIVNTELGSVELEHDKLARSKIFLYVDGKKKVIGCVVTEHITRAYKVLNDDGDPEHDVPVNNDVPINNDGSAVFCSTKSVPAVCGISRIWVTRKSRRQGIATLLLDVIRAKFIYGCNLSRDKLAFSQPTRDGKALATKYVGTSEFLVYAEE